MTRNILLLIALLIFSWGKVSAQFNKSQLASNIAISFKVDTLEGLNSDLMEFSPVIYKNKLVFTSNREYDKVNYGMNHWNRNSNLSLFWVELGGMADSLKFKNIKPLSNKINTRDHTGPLTFTQDDQVAVFTRVSGKTSVNGEKVKKPSLYGATFDNQRWDSVKEVNFVNKQYSYAHPTLTPDGETLFFTSDQEGTKGGQDIWISTRTKGEEWSAPENFKKINTSGNEMFPFYKDSTLFFSSKREGGAGGLDLYCTVLKANGEWTEPESLGETINSQGDDFGFFLHKSSNWGYFSSNREGGQGKDDIYRFEVIEKVTVKKQSVSGKFDYRKLSSDKPSGMKVMLVNDEGEVVESTTTDSLGEFSFKQLPADKAYTVKLDNDGEEVELTLYGEGADRFLLSNSEGEFVYRKLPSDKAGTLTLMEVDDSKMDAEGRGNVSGQFIYEKLASDHPEGMEVMLVNDEGEVVKRTTTDENGNFQFRDLPSDKSYLVKLKENDPDMALLVYGNDDRVRAQLKQNDDGEFVYRKLGGMKGGELALLNEEDPSLDYKPTNTVLAKFDYQNLEGNPAGMKVVAETDDGEVTYTAKTDSNGYFRLTGLPDYDKMVIKPENPTDDELKMTVFTRNKNVEMKVDPNEEGAFVYRKLESDKASMTAEEVEEDDPELDEKGNASERSNSPADEVIYFNKNSSILYRSDKKILDKVVQKMQDSPSLKLRVDGYASAPAPERYNNWLTDRRVDSVKQYIVKQGIESNRIQVNSRGESNFLNECKNGVECSDEKHAENRRAELYYED